MTKEFQMTNDQSEREAVTRVQRPCKMAPASGRKPGLEPESQRASVSKPRVAPTAPPWLIITNGPQPQRGCDPGAACRPPGHNPVGVGAVFHVSPRVGARRQPWALSHNLVGIASPEPTRMPERSSETKAHLPQVRSVGRRHGSFQSFGVRWLQRRCRAGRGCRQFVGLSCAQQRRRAARTPRRYADGELTRFAGAYRNAASKRSVLFKNRRTDSLQKFDPHLTSGHRCHC